MFNHSWADAPVLKNNLVSFNGTSDTDRVFTDAEFVAVKSLFALSSLVGSVENIVVIVAILTSDILLDIPSNWFVLSLALADALVCILALPFLGVQEIILAEIFQAFAILTLFSSSGNLLILTFNRFLSVYDSLKYPSRMTVGRAKRLVLVPWGLAFFFAITAMVVYLADVPVQALRYIWIVYYFVVTTLVVALNGYTLKKAKDHHKTIKRQHNSVITGQQKSLMREYRSFFRLVAVIMTFFAACISNMSVSFAYPTKNDRQSSSFVRMATLVYLVNLLNAMFDPLVYFISSKEFKRYLTKVKRCVFGRNDMNGIKKGVEKHVLFVSRSHRVVPAERQTTPAFFKG